MKPLVGIIIGSDTDRELVAPATQILDEYEVPYELSVMSAHRSPDRVRTYAQTAEERGIQVLIAAAGYAAHLPGVLASWSMLPVIGVPLPTSPLNGFDSLLSIAQMPGGVPVSCVGIGKGGSKNAALAAIQILALHDDRLREAYRTYREKLACQ